MDKNTLLVEVTFSFSWKHPISVLLVPEALILYLDLLAPLLALLALLFPHPEDGKGDPVDDLLLLLLYLNLSRTHV